MTTFCVSIDGLIGVGKTTVLKCLREKTPHVNIIPEPIEQFTKFQNYNPLVQAYQRPQTDASLTQIHIIKCIAENFQNNFKENQINICERVCHSSKIFVKTNYDLENFSCFVKDFLINYTEQAIDAKYKPHVIFF